MQATVHGGSGENAYSYIRTEEELLWDEWFYLSPDMHGSCVFEPQSLCAPEWSSRRRRSPRIYREPERTRAYRPPQPNTFAQLDSPVLDLAALDAATVVMGIDTYRPAITNRHMQKAGDSSENFGVAKQSKSKVA